MREEELLFTVYLLLLRIQTSRDTMKVTVEFLKIKNEVLHHTTILVLYVCVYYNIVQR